MSEDYDRLFGKGVNGNLNLHAREEGMTRAKKYMRGMNSLANGGSFSGSKTAGQYGAEATADAYRKNRKAVGLDD